MAAKGGGGGRRRNRSESADRLQRWTAGCGPPPLAGEGSEERAGLGFSLDRGSGGFGQGWRGVLSF